jgi:alanyl-tRNA synthetase
LKEEVQESGYSLIDGEKVWYLHATHGFVVELSLPLLADRGFIPTWDRILDAAESDGVNIRRLVERLKIAAEDAYEPRVSRRVKKGLDLLLVWRRSDDE